MVENVVHLELSTCQSTNEELKKLAVQGVKAGSSVMAAHQSAGRGRQGRNWESLEGNLFLSFLYEVPKPESGNLLKGVFEFSITWIPIVVGVAVIKVIREKFPTVASLICLKWPNDLVVKRPQAFAKCGGILCELQNLSVRKLAIIGVGLNVMRSPQLDDREATSLAAELSSLSGGPQDLRLPELTILRDQIIAHAFELLRVLENSGAQLFEAEFFRYSLNQVGDSIKWADRDSQKHQGRICGLGSYGELMVEQRDRNGNPKLTELYSEEIHLI